MSHTLTHSYSPLSQLTTRVNHSSSKSSARQLSAKDQATLDAVLADRCDVIPSVQFEDSDAYRKLFLDSPRIDRVDTSWYHPVMDKATDARALQQIGGNLLTGPQERQLFLQFNYCRLQVRNLKDRYLAKPDHATAREILDWHVKADALREQIAESNLALVLAMAKRMRLNDVEFSDLVSDGNMALLRAVDKFDAERGFKFSTYACRAILKSFSRLGIKATKYKEHFPTDFDPKFEKSDHIESRRESHEDECVDELRDIIKENRAALTPIEQSVIVHRFSLGKVAIDESSDMLTLEQVGKLVGLTKERVRQIQNKAMAKIRQTLEQGFLR